MLQSSTSTQPVATTATVKPTAQPSTSTTTSSTPSYIYATSVQALFTYNAGTRTYDPLSKGPTGCVIVGSNTQYSLMFYDANKTTLCMAPITPQVSFTHSGGERIFVRTSGNVGRKDYIVDGRYVGRGGKILDKRLF